MVFRDLEVSILGSASIADQPCSGKEQNGDIEQQNTRHADQDRDVGHISEDTDQAQGKCQNNHEWCDLREGFVLEEMVASADDASPKLSGIVECPFPVEKNLSISVECPDSSGALVSIGHYFPDLRSINLTNQNSHGFRWYDSAPLRDTVDGLQESGWEAPAGV